MNKGIKHDQGKIKWSYLPIKPIIEVLKVLAYGDKKYPAPDGANWKRVEDPKKRYYNAAMRHMTAWYDGEENDPESGLSHLAHGCTCLLILLWFSLNLEKEEQKQTSAEDSVTYKETDWIPHSGRMQPVADKVFVKIKLRDGGESDSYEQSSQWDWRTSFSDDVANDIIAYKVKENQ